jgi:tetratricopeptide (TPR) repeat protein
VFYITHKFKIVVCFFILCAFFAYEPCMGSCLSKGASHEAGYSNGFFSFFRGIIKNSRLGLACGYSQKSRLYARVIPGYIKGVVLQNKREYQSALDEFKRLALYLPESGYPKLRMAYCYMGLGLYKKARQELECVLQTDNNNLRARFISALLYTRQNDLNSALLEYEKILAQDPGNLSALSFLEDFKRGKNLMENNTPCGQ